MFFTRNASWVAAFMVMGVLLLSAKAGAEGLLRASGADPAAVHILKTMTGYLGGLNRFSVRTENTLEDWLESGHRVDFDVSAEVIVRRPDRLRAERKGDQVEQVFCYDGKTLTLYNPSDGVYATEPAPASIEGLLDYVRDSLGLIVPAADLIYRQNFQLLMQDVTFAMVLGKSFIGGVRCDHLLFSRPGVDFQVWVADAGPPLPYKYVVTDTGVPGALSITTVMSDWNTAPEANDSQFAFVAPRGSERIRFMTSETGSGYDR